MNGAKPAGIFIDGALLVPERPRRPPSRIRDDGAPLAELLAELDRTVEQLGGQVLTRVVARDWSDRRTIQPTVIEVLQRAGAAMVHVPDFGLADRARSAWRVGEPAVEAAESAVTAMLRRAEAWAEPGRLVLLVLDERRMMLNGFQLERLRERAEVVGASIEHAPDGTRLRVVEGAITSWPARVWEPQR